MSSERERGGAGLQVYADCASRRKMHIDVRSSDGPLMPRKVNIRGGKELNKLRDINTVSPDHNTVDTADMQY